MKKYNVKNYVRYKEDVKRDIIKSIPNKKLYRLYACRA